MESLEHLHKQLDRLDDLRTIVKTMKALSAASIRQYELAVAALDGYARSVTRGLYVALRNTASAARPAAGEQAGVVVFGSDHGLCGRFNEAVAEHALDAMAAMPAPPLILAVGTRAAGSLEHAGRSVEEVFLVPGSAARITDTVQQILLKVDQWQSDAGVSRVWLFYNGHAGGRRHEPRSDSLLPVDLGRFRRAAEVWPSRSLPIFTMERDRLVSASRSPVPVRLRVPRLCRITGQRARQPAGGHAVRRAQPRRAFAGRRPGVPPRTADGDHGGAAGRGRRLRGHRRRRRQRRSTVSDSGARIYNLFPRLVGDVSAWHVHLPRIAAMGFDWIFLNPFHLTGASGSVYSVSDYYRLDSALQGARGDGPDALLRGFVDAAADVGISVMMDLVINHTAIDSPLVQRHPEWYVRDADGRIQSPFAVDPDDPSQRTVWQDLGELDYRPRPARDALLDYWNALTAHYAGLGFRGFRCDAAYKLPGEVWQSLIGNTRSKHAGITFFAETLGARVEEVAQLAPAGFDYLFNSAKWWDFRAPWLLDQYERFRRLAPSVAFPESHDTERLAADHAGSERESRFRYLFSACFSTGVMMPIGYEFGFRRRLNVVDTRPDHWENPAFDISACVAAVNAMKRDTQVLNEEGPQQRITEPDEPVVALVRRSEVSAQRSAVLINPDPDNPHVVGHARLCEALEIAPQRLVEITPEPPPPGRNAGSGGVALEPRSLRIFVTA